MSIAPRIEDFCSVDARLRTHPDMFVVEGNGINLFLLRNFMSSAECAVMKSLIDAYNRPSKVMGVSDDPMFRTSHSSPLAWSRHALIEAVDARICDLTGIDREFQESIEGQRYGPGQEFKPHFDTFPVDQPYWPEQDRIGGQRTWTVMICVGQPEAGGGTMFPTAGVRMKPRVGNLLAWNNLDAMGGVNAAALHCGERVEAGMKHILTKWHRERPFMPDCHVEHDVSSRLDQLKQKTG